MKQKIYNYVYLLDNEEQLQIFEVIRKNCCQAIRKSVIPSIGVFIDLEKVDEKTLKYIYDLFCDKCDKCILN